MDAVETAMAATIGLLLLGLAGLIGVGIYDACVAETFSLRKDGWSCTQSHAELVPMTTLVGKVPVTSLLPRTVCDQWSAR